MRSSNYKSWLSLLAVFTFSLGNLGKYCTLPDGKSTDVEGGFWPEGTECGSLCDEDNGYLPHKYEFLN